MGAVPAMSLGSPEAQQEGVERRRIVRLAGVGEALRLYEELELALGRIRDADLAQIAAAAREGEQGLEEWESRVEAFRAFKRRFEAGVYPLEGPCREAPGLPLSARQGPAVGRGSVPYAWEALAFLIGFMASLLLT